MYVGKRSASDGTFSPCQEHAVVIEPISIVDDVCTEDEEDAYEEMDEEDEERPTSTALLPVIPYKEVESLGTF
ncbi:unnamed protein product [Strongylus vulgaris]|uniref:Uncharacterized protein n=1 Tax=Strongylus vulgaris TaxID=40348 RepID=A0A3P7IRB4_STRVU|nr:unnamed protein product [Strongylus vulgaris]